MPRQGSSHGELAAPSARPSAAFPAEQAGRNRAPASGGVVLAAQRTTGRHGREVPQGPAQGPIATTSTAATAATALNAAPAARLHRHNFSSRMAKPSSRGSPG